MQYTLIQVVSPWKTNSVVSKVILVLIGTLALALSAKIQVPFWPVPMTMQTFVVLLLGLAYGPKLGAITGLSYLAEGAIGLPVFAGGGGGAYLIGPTGGYLFGFVLAMGMVGWLAAQGWDRSWRSLLFAMILGELIIFGAGVSWLSTFTGLEKAIEIGLTPFIVAEIFKIALVVISLPMIWGRLGSSASKRRSGKR